MERGDPSLSVKEHPKYGKILVAARDLPKGYYVAWWGVLKNEKALPDKNWEWALRTAHGMVDATGCPGSQLQFCACPGPNELSTINFAQASEALLTKDRKTCLIFSTLRDIPKNHQLTMMYNYDEATTNEFFEERGLTRADVGTKKYPALRKKMSGPAPWEQQLVAAGA